MGDTDLSGFRQIVSRLESEAENLQGPVAQGMIEGGEIWLEYLRSRFDTQGDGEWAPLAESTIKQRERKGYGAGPILQETGELLNSLMPGDPNNVLRVTPDGLELGTEVDYAPYVQASRPFIVDPDGPTRQRMEAALQRGIDNLTREL